MKEYIEKRHNLILVENLPYFTLDFAHYLINIDKGLLSREESVDVVNWIKICLV